MFNGVQGVSIGGDALNVVHGDQYNEATTIIDRIVRAGRTVVKKRRDADSEYNQYREIFRGDINKLEQLSSEDYWDWEWKDGRRVRTHSYRRTVHKAQVYGDHKVFTAISYHGRDAKKIWKRKLMEYPQFMQHHSLTFIVLTTISDLAVLLQLFGISRSNVPTLLFYDNPPTNGEHEQGQTSLQQFSALEYTNNPPTNGEHEQGQTSSQRSSAPEHTNNPPTNGNHEQGQIMFAQSSGTIADGRFNNVLGNQVNIENHPGRLYMLGMPQFLQFNIAADQSAMLRLLENAGNTAMTVLQNIGIFSYDQLLRLASSLELPPIDIELVLLLAYHTFEPQITRMISETPVYQLLR
ncbi:hypothetical protein MPER_10789 [Moniliophthora perniciosa FA553]|nr:hypothetical protein MPER_10789 [Moniliophthora perniciosa FA553]